MAESANLLAALVQHGGVVSGRVPVPVAERKSLQFKLSIKPSGVNGGGNGLFLTFADGLDGQDVTESKLDGLHGSDEVCVGFVAKKSILGADRVIEAATDVDAVLENAGDERGKLRFSLGTFLEDLQEDDHAPPLNERTLVMFFLVYLRTISAVEPSPNSQADTAILSVLAPFKAHLAVLPTLADFDIPVTWTPAQRELLKGTDLYAGADAKVKTLQGEWDVVGEGFKNAWEMAGFEAEVLKWLDFEAWLWADCVWWSRVLEIPGQTDAESGGGGHSHDHSRGHTESGHGDHSHDHGGHGHGDDKSSHAVIPLVDMMNHSSTPNARWEPTAGGIAIMVKREWIQSVSDEGDHELTMSYGDKPNERLLFLHGFTLPSPPKLGFALPLPLGPPSSDPENPSFPDLQRAITRMLGGGLVVHVMVDSDAVGKVEAAKPAEPLTDVFGDSVEEEGVAAVYVAAMEEGWMDLAAGGGGCGHDHDDGREGHVHSHPAHSHSHNHAHGDSHGHGGHHEDGQDSEEEDEEAGEDQSPGVVLFPASATPLAIPLHVGPGVFCFVVENGVAEEDRTKVVAKATELVRGAVKRFLSGLEESAVVVEKATGMGRKVGDVKRLREDQKKAAEWVLKRLG